MICHKYKNALLLAAATNNELEAKLAQHLERCSKCRTTLCSERELFSRIDSALRAQVNSEPRPGFLTELRVQLSKEQGTQPVSNRVWPAAGAALALILTAMLYPLANPRQRGVAENVQTPAIQVPQTALLTRPVPATEHSGVRSHQYSKRTVVKTSFPQEPDVLVPPDERKAFAQFVARVAGRDAMVQAVVSPAANKTASRNAGLPEVPSVNIADLQLDKARQKEWIAETDSSE
jgi:hypothetical protein